MGELWKAMHNSSMINNLYFEKCFNLASDQFFAYTLINCVIKSWQDIK